MNNINKKISIKEEKSKSPFVLDLRENKSEVNGSFCDFSIHKPKPRKLVSYYYKFKYYFLLFLCGERECFSYDIHRQQKSFILLNNLFLLPYRFSKVFYHFLKIFLSPFLFLLKSFKDIFIANKNEVSLRDLESSLLYHEPSFAFSRISFKKHFAAFLAISLIIISPFSFYSLFHFLQARATSAEESGKMAVQVLASEFNNNNLDKGLRVASLNFASAYRDLEDINFFLRGLLNILPGQKGDEYRMAKKIFQAAYETTSVIPIWKDAIDSLKKVSKQDIDNVDKSIEEEDNLERLDILEKTIKLTEPKISTAFYNLNSIDSKKLPKEIQNVFESARNYFYQAIKGLEEAEDGIVFLRKALGSEEPKRYLLIFQNNNEMRPTGGFMGSFAEITVSKGKIIKTFFPGGGTYDLKGLLKRFVAPPKPLQLVNERWEFQDANWFPDFPYSARKIIWFYENSDGPTIDGVIAFNANFVVDLLESLGPVELKEWDTVLTADNFIDKVEELKKSESALSQNQPKKILVDFYPLLLKKIENAWNNNFVETVKIFSNAVLKRNIQFYFTDPDLEKKVLAYGAGGEIQSTDGDYLYIVNTNIAGGKTDGKISEIVNLKTEISKSGIVTNTLKVTRKHNGVKGQGFSGVRNVDYVRVYVPKGSQLIKAEGFQQPAEKFFKVPLANLEVDKDLSSLEKFIGYDNESGTVITEEFNKTVFGNWLMVDPGEEITYTLVYQLPFLIPPTDRASRDFSTYSLFVQKQSGSNPLEFSHNIKVPQEFHQFWIYPQTTNETIVLEKDFFKAIVFTFQ